MLSENLACEVVCAETNSVFAEGIWSERRKTCQKTARAEIRKPRKPKSEKRVSEKRKTLTFQPLQDKIIEQIIL